jgi:Calx-beta domain
MTQTHGSASWARRALTVLVVAATSVGSAVVLSSAPASAATSTTVAVGPGDVSPNGSWSSPAGSDTGTLGFVAGPATPPAGSGSLSIALANTSQHRAFYTYGYGTCAVSSACDGQGTDLGDITKLQYSTYRDASSTQPGVVPSFNVEIDPDSTTTSGTNYTSLVWEPAGNGGGVVDNTWQSWNPYVGNWYATSDLSAYGVLACAPFTCTATWSQITSAMPNAIVRFGLGPNAGSGWSSFSGNVDRLVVGVSNNDVIYDFEQPPHISVGDASIREGDSGTRIIRLMISLDRISPGSGVTTQWATAGGTATSGVDFKARHGRLYFKPGQTTRYAKVIVKPDALTEGNEQFTVYLGGVIGALVSDSTGVATIVDDEAVNGTVASIGDASVREGQSGGSRYVFLAVSLNQPAGTTASVHYTTGGGTAIAPYDYSGRSGTIVFRPKARVMYVLIYLTADQYVEGNETFNVTLSSPVNLTIGDGTGTVTIVNDD